MSNVQRQNGDESQGQGWEWWLGVVAGSGGWEWWLTACSFLPIMSCPAAS